MNIPRILEITLDIALSNDDSLKHVGDIIEEIENENILCELIKHKAWEVRYSLVGRASHIMLLVLERDDDERVQRAAVEKHAIELITLAEIIAKNNMLRLNAIAEA